MCIRDRFQSKVLVPYLETKRWFAAKGHQINRVKLLEQAAWDTARGSWLLTVVEVQCAGLPSQLYFLPLAIGWDEETAEEQRTALAAWTLARVRQKDRTGLLYGCLLYTSRCV